MALAIFDLDNTLIADDSDYLWAKFMMDKQIVDKKKFMAKNEKFYYDYLQGNLDIITYQSFIITPLMPFSKEQLSQWHNEFMQEYIQPIILPKAKQLLNKHFEQKHDLLIITATNSFITKPIAQLYGIDNLIATELEIINDKFTGNIQGIPSFQNGKVVRLEQWLTKNNKTLKGSYFYSDSHNDIPLLNIVDNPIAVDPDPTLKKFANKNNWQIISLR